MNTSYYLSTISLIVLSSSLLGSKAPEASAPVATKKPQIIYMESTIKTLFNIVQSCELFHEKTGESIQEIATFEPGVRLPSVVYRCNNFPKVYAPSIALIAKLQAYKIIALKEELEQSNPTSSLLSNTYSKKKSWDAE